MAIMRSRLSWTGGLKFSGTGTFGHTIVTDVSKDKGGTEAGFRPTELLMFALAGCTGIDVVRILEKQCQEVSNLEIEVSAEASDSEALPMYFEKIQIFYRFSGNGLDKNKIAKAIELSESKYCIVSETLRQKVRVTTSYEIVTD